MVEPGSDRYLPTHCKQQKYSYNHLYVPRTLTVESAFPDTSMFFLSSIPLVRDWWPVEESIAAVTALRHHTSKFTNLWECGYTAHCPHSILLLKCPVNHLLCEHHQTTSKKYNQHYSEQTSLIIKYDYSWSHLLTGSTCSLVPRPIPDIISQQWRKIRRPGTNTT